MPAKYTSAVLFAALLGASAFAATPPRSFEVTTNEDFGAGSLRAVIEQVNSECAAALVPAPCIVTFARPMRIAPKLPLPVITACNTIIDGGKYEGGLARNRSFDVPRRVEIDGAEVESGSGLRIQAACGLSLIPGATLRGLAIHSFPAHGLEVIDPTVATITVERCSIGTNAEGREARPNGLRGVNVRSPYTTANIRDCLLAGNVRSGVALEQFASAQLRGNLIGVRFGGAPLPNGASGVYVADRTAFLSGNAIEYNREFGVAVSRTAHIMSDGDFICLNGGIGIDYGLDGPDALRDSGVRIIDAYYDPAKKLTIITSVLTRRQLRSDRFYGLRFALNGADARDYDGGLMASAYGLVPGGGEDAVFTTTLVADLRGRRIVAQVVTYPFLDALPSEVSEYSAGLMVR